MAVKRWEQAALRANTRPGADVSRSPRERSNSYDRDAMLPRLLPLWSTDVTDPSPEARRAIVRRLERALRAERRMGRAGNAAYNLERHFALARALAAERALARLTQTTGAKAAGLISAARPKTKGPADRSTGPDIDRFDQPQASSRLRC